VDVETDAAFSVPYLHRGIVGAPHDPLVPVTATATAGVESRPACQSDENTGARYDDNTFFTCASKAEENIDCCHPVQERSPFGSPRSGHKTEAYAPSDSRNDAPRARTTDAKFPKFANDDKRFESFPSNWKPDAPSAERLARYGFFYEGKIFRRRFTYEVSLSYVDVP